MEIVNYSKTLGRKEWDEKLTHSADITSRILPQKNHLKQQWVRIVLLKGQRKLQYAPQLLQQLQNSAKFQVGTVWLCHEN